MTRARKRAGIVCIGTVIDSARADLHSPGGRLDTTPSIGARRLFVRRGCFVRSAEGVETLLDPRAACFLYPGREQRYDHPLPGGDETGRTPAALRAALATAGAATPA